MVSGGEFWPIQRELSRHLKYIARARIPKFESSHPSHAVRSPSGRIQDSSGRLRSSLRPAWFVFARHRDKWADLLLRTALWMREAPLELDLCWRELAIVAKALADGRER